MIKNYLIKNIANIEQKELEEMYFLMSNHYNNVNKEKFMKDFLSKEGVILLYDAFQNIKGFSTYVFYIIEFQNEKIKILFSGDTIIDASCWGGSYLFEAFIELMIKTYQTTEIKLYWLLITKGFRTYQIPTIYFKEFYPCVNQIMPLREAQLIDIVLRKIFREYWHANEFLVKYNPPADYLKKEFAIIDEHKARNAHVRFFLEKNPGYVNGDEMPCLTRIEPANFSRLTLKYARKYGI